MTQLTYCAEQIRRFDKDRFICSLFAPPAEREALAALYAFNLEVARTRQSVREPMLGRIRLQWWRESIDAIYAGSPPRHEVVAALADAVSRYALSRIYFERVFVGRAFDFEDRAPASLDELVAYADATSASVVTLASEVLGARDAEVQQAARHLGIAWALTGLIRSVPFHARARRTYLPAELNRNAGLDVFRLFEKGPSPGLAGVVSILADSARKHLVQARSHRPQVPPSALPAFLIATMADGYLRQIAAAGNNPFDHRVQAAGAGRLVRVAVNRWRGRY